MSKPATLADAQQGFIRAIQFLVGRERWMERAACRGADTSIFFPERGGSQREAKAFCARCPVRAECQDYSERSNSTWGIWGGEIKRRGPDRDDDVPRSAPTPPPLRITPPAGLIPPD